ncbi:MAG: hypothetical protein F2563_01540 [Actinobacteria bacterium]|jgi:hypothetical protein|uniref:Unannotated protein n=1 Tax=freshwater metagenome TaxID=449393 RepID=A0A6J6E4R8_9ZZZZ|nr:hypothetical protein [Actinomycetota bacterium]
MNRLSVKICCEIELDGKRIYKLDASNEVMVAGAMRELVEHIREPFLKKMFQDILDRREGTVFPEEIGGNHARGKEYVRSLYDSK